MLLAQQNKTILQVFLILSYDYKSNCTKIKRLIYTSII